MRARAHRPRAGRVTAGHARRHTRARWLDQPGTCRKAAMGASKYMAMMGKALSAGGGGACVRAFVRLHAERCHVGLTCSSSQVPR